MDFYDSSGTLLNSVALVDSGGISQPSSPVDFTYPEYDGQTGIPTHPTFIWAVSPSAGDALWMSLLDCVVDENIYESFPASMTTLSWTPGPLQPNHEYELEVSVINVKNLQPGPELPTMTANGDTFEYCLMIEYYNDIEFTTISVPAIEAAIDIDPDTLNLQSKGEWITCYIWLPEGYDVADIDPESILLNGQVVPDWGRVDETGQMLIVKFNSSEVQDILEVGEVELTISGELTDGTKFEGTDTITVIDKGGKK